MRSRASWVRHLAFVAVLVVGAAACSTAGSDALEVPADYPTLGDAVAAASDGATITVAPGRYEESVSIDRPLRLVADPGSVEIVGVAGVPVISINGTTGVTIQGLDIIGGVTGVAVIDSTDIVISNNRIVDSTHRGVDVVYSAATVTGNEIRPAAGPYVIGIRLANAVSLPESMISGNVVQYADGYGIAVNFANATVDGNDVIGGERAGIAINEMSLGTVLGNTVSDASRYGILVHDMSHAVVSDNVISGADEPIKLTYHSTVELSGNETD